MASTRRKRLPPGTLAATPKRPHPFTPSCHWNPGSDQVTEPVKRVGKKDFKLPSGSKLGRQLVCPASIVLPKAESENPFSDRGRAIHLFLERASVVGRDRALAEVGPKWREACVDIDVTRIPKGCTAEVAFAYDAIGGTGRLVGTSVGRNYGPRGAWDIFATADLYKITDGKVYIGDWKTTSGHDTYAPAASENWQLKIMALAAARAFGGTSADIAIIKVYPDGTIGQPDVHHMDAMELDECAVTIKEFALRAERIHGRFQDFKEVPDPVEGEHCKWCPSFQFCPTKTAIVRHVAGEPVTFENSLKALTPATAGKAWKTILDAESMIKRAKDAIRQMAEHNPVQLPNGRVLGPVEIPRESVDGMEAFRVLSEMCDRQTAQSAVELSSSKEAIRRAIRPVAETRGISLAQLEREVLAELRSRNGVRTSSQIQIRETGDRKSNPQSSGAKDGQ